MAKKNTHVDWSKIEPGFYWAYQEDYEWNNLIVEVYGERPFLKMKAWKIDSERVLSIDPDKVFGMQAIVEPDQI